jgi:hypothetical protein
MVADKAAHDARSVEILTDNCGGEGPVTELIVKTL